MAVYTVCNVGTTVVLARYETLLTKFSILYFPYQKDERAMPGNLLNEVMLSPLPALAHINVSVVLSSSYLYSVTFTYHRCLCTVLVFVAAACLGCVRRLWRCFCLLAITLTEKR